MLLPFYDNIYVCQGIRCNDTELYRAVAEKDKITRVAFQIPEHLHKAFNETAVPSRTRQGTVSIELIEKCGKKASDLL
jgi:hypothetical protein